MGNPKQKWTAEEEEALIKGIAKHGVGKWKNIETDPELNIHFRNRTNIDLKDKWRNISPVLQGSSTRSRNPKAKLAQYAAAAAAAPPSVHIQTPSVQAVISATQINHVKEEPVKDIRDTKNGPSCNNDTTGMVVETVSAAEEQNGMDVDSIVSYVEERITGETAQTNKKQLGARRRRPGQQDKLEKVEKSCKLKKTSLVKTNTNNRKDILARQGSDSSYIKLIESLEEAAKTAASKVAEAEDLSYLAVQSLKEAEGLAKMQEEAESIFQLAHEICDRFKYRTLSAAV